MFPAVSRPAYSPIGVKSRRSTTFQGIAALALGGLTLLGGRLAQAHDPRLDTAGEVLDDALGNR